MNDKIFPSNGWSKGDVQASLKAYKADDIDWRHGRAPMFVFYADDEHNQVIKDAYNEYFTVNATGTTSFAVLSARSFKAANFMPPFA